MSNAKIIRGQLRQIAKDMLPEVLTIELMEAIRKELRNELIARLEAIDERQKQLQGYMVRQSVAHIPTEPPKKD